MAIRFLLHEETEIRELCVDPLTETLGNIVPDHSNVTFVYKGVPINPAFSLAFSGIKDGADVFVVQKARKRQRLVPLAQFTKYLTPMELMDPKTRADWFLRVFGFTPNHEAMQNFVDEMTDPTLAREVARLKDQFFGKIEGNGTCHRKVMRHFVEKKDKVEEVTEVAERSRFERAQTPSTRELPILWN